jgi:hypothetical protein
LRNCRLAAAPVEEYQRMASRKRGIVTLLDLPEAGEIEIEPPRRGKGKTVGILK